MNLYKEFSEKDIELIKKAGISIEDKNYSNEELYKFQTSIIDYIMSASSKNGEIDKRRNQFESVLRTINIKQKLKGFEII